MEQDKVVVTYKFLKGQLGNKGYDIVLDANYTHNQKRYYFDLIVGKDNKEIAVFEFKQTIDWNNIHNRLYEKCQIFQKVFSKVAPLIFISDGEKYALFAEPSRFESPITKDEMVKLILQKGEDINKIEPKKDEVIAVLKKFGKQMDEFVNVISSKGSDIYDSDAKYFYFKEEYEKLFFRYLLGEEPKCDLYRYTSIETLFKTLTSRKQSMSSILGMTDRTESYYADYYFTMRINGLSKDSYKKTEQYQQGCHCFILSCVKEEKENIRMWDEYGDCAKGVRIRLSPKEDRSSLFWIAPISYAKDDNTHPEIDLLVKLRQIGWDMKSWNVWQHFFKPNEFVNEQEVRLLYICDDSALPNEDINWLHKGETIFPLFMFDMTSEKNYSFPYEISSITFGPLCHNQEESKSAIKELLLSNHFFDKTTDLDELFQISKIQEEYENW